MTDVELPDKWICTLQADELGRILLDAWNKTGDTATRFGLGLRIVCFIDYLEGKERVRSASREWRQPTNNNSGME